MDAFLAELGLADLQPLMAQHRITLAAARLLSESDWAAINVPLGARRLIMAKLAEAAPRPASDQPPRRRIVSVRGRQDGDTGSVVDDAVWSLLEGMVHTEQGSRHTHCTHCRGLDGACGCNKGCAKYSNSMCYAPLDPRGNKRHAIYVTLDAGESVTNDVWSRITRLALRVLRQLQENVPEALLSFVTTNKHKTKTIVKRPALGIAADAVAARLATTKRDAASDIGKIAFVFAEPAQADLAKSEAEYETVSYIFLASTNPEVDVQTGILFTGYIKARQKSMVWVNLGGDGALRAAMVSPLAMVHPNARSSSWSTAFALPLTEKAPAVSETCTICVDAPRDTVVVPCGHCFGCEKCTARSLLVRIDGDVCPQCRGKVKETIGLAKAQQQQINVIFS